MWATEVIASYNNDAKCKELQTHLVVSPNSMTNHTFSNGLLRYKNRLIIGAERELGKKLIVAMHKSDIGCHSG